MFLARLFGDTFFLMSSAHLIPCWLLESVDLFPVLALYESVVLSSRMALLCAVALLAGRFEARNATKSLMSWLVRALPNLRFL
jgi:hypothetical protein